MNAFTFKCLALLGWVLLANSAQAQEQYPEVQIVEPYIELHSGPARGYPVFHVAKKGQWLRVTKERGGWFKVLTAKGKHGWVSQQSLLLTLNVNGEKVMVDDGSLQRYQQRNFELGATGGALEGVPSIGVFASWVITENIATELDYRQALGDFSENRIALLSVTHTAFPEWRVSPFFRLGMGQIQTKPQANLVQSGAETRRNDVLAVGAGVRYYLGKNFLVKLEYQNLLALTQRDDNEELEQWKFGFAVFF